MSGPAGSERDKRAAAAVARRTWIALRTCWSVAYAAMGTVVAPRKASVK